MKRRRISPGGFCMLFYGLIFIAFIALHFPYATDPQTAPAPDSRGAENFYQKAYAAPSAPSKEEQEREEVYVRVAQRAAEAYNIKGMVQKFVQEYQLQKKRILEVGAGRGYLQDVVDDYTGLDISPAARRYFHKPFVQASATAMPFRDGEFDAIWTIWVLEHIPNPESALREMRRVVKPGGLILLFPAWFCPPWAAQGYQVRPYSDFGISEKLVKASIPIRGAPLFQMLYVMPIRALRYAATRIDTTPTRFHYRRLTPNYEQYWMPDSDAVNSMDPYEAMLWFETRSDRCLNCPEPRHLTGIPDCLIIQVDPRDQR